MPRSDPGADIGPVTWDQVHAFRMARHHLAEPLPRTRIAQAAGDACGVQAQVMAAAQLGLRVRVRGLTLEDVDRALWQDRSLARVWSVRGTVHLVPSDECTAFVRGCSSRQEERIARWMVRSGAPEDRAEQLIRAATGAMDRPRTREEITEIVQDSLGWATEKGGGRGWGNPSDAAGFRLGKSVVSIPDVAWMASFRGLVCFGPDAGGGTTFVRPDVWLPGWRDISLESAEDTLLRRYLGSFGPATVHDFAAWCVLTVARSREIWSRVEREMAPVSLDGRPAWVLRRDRSALERADLGGTTVRLLPYFDSFLLGHKGRDHLVDGAHYKRIYRPAGWVYPAVLVDGRVAGEWTYERKGKTLRVRVVPYRRLTREVQRLVQREADDVARFLESPEVRVSFAKPR